MNKVVLMGRLTRDPETKYTADSLCITRYTLAVDRRFRKENEAAADFIPCVAFGKTAEIAERYFRQGMRVTISGRIQTGSYTNNRGDRVYTTEVVVEEQEFAESKNASHSGVPERNAPSGDVDESGFMNIPEGYEDDIPFS